MAFRWHADYGPILNAGLEALRGIRTSIANKTKRPGGGRIPCPPRLDPHMHTRKHKHTRHLTSSVTVTRCTTKFSIPLMCIVN